MILQPYCNSKYVCIWLGKIAQTSSNLLWESVARKSGHMLLWKTGRKGGRRNSAQIQMSIKANNKPYDITSWSTQTALSQRTSLDGGSLSSRAERLHMGQWSQQLLCSDHGSTGSLTCRTVAVLPEWHTGLSQTKWTCYKRWSLEWAAWLAHTNLAVDLLPWLSQNQRKWLGRLTGKHSRHHDWPTACQGRGAQRLEESSEHG